MPKVFCDECKYFEASMTSYGTWTYRCLYSAQKETWKSRHETIYPIWSPKDQNIYNQCPFYQPKEDYVKAHQKWPE